MVIRHHKENFNIGSVSPLLIRLLFAEELLIIHRPVITVLIAPSVFSGGEKLYTTLEIETRISQNQQASRVLILIRCSFILIDNLLRFCGRNK